MFSRFLKTALKAIPIIATSLLYQSFPFSLHTSKLNPKINIVMNLGQHVQKISPNTAVIFCQLQSDDFINSQLLNLAQQFLNSQPNLNCEFIFVPQQEEGDDGTYFMVYSSWGQKIINVQDIQVDARGLFIRLSQAIGGTKQINLTNLAQQLNLIKNTNRYSALISIPQNQLNTKQAKINLINYLKNNTVQSKNLSKFVVTDSQSQGILGLSNKKGLYLLVPKTQLNHNINIQNQKIFKIQDKQLIAISIDEKINQKIVFPPIINKPSPNQFVLNVYINKNNDTFKIQQDLKKQLSKDFYNKYIKNIYYSSQVKYVTLTLQMHDFTKVTQQPYQPNTKLSKKQIKQLLLNSYQWNLNFNKNDSVQTQKIQKWLSALSKPQHNFQTQYFKSQVQLNTNARQIVGQQYKQILQKDCDKIIYHYSQHCHGCKKFGGKYQNFAKNKSQFNNLNFYRINNDNNKTQGIRNYNSTPVFAYYKNNCKTPFIYKMPIFTQQIFQNFLKITGQVSLMPWKNIQSSVLQRSKHKQAIKDFLKQ